ncbi:MAG: hypothetical protein DCC55_30585 [Chloroflexi bacterium]|nr:MAG: hypothetical protein DCC55_30585 [Chloroflexota bacterium]
MSDKPKPGKDKDLRFIRQAMEATQALFSLLGEQIAEPEDPRYATLLAEALLLATDQLDLLDQMLADATCAPTLVIDQNRQLRRLVRRLLHENGSANHPALARVAHATGTQLNALLVVKEIRQPH